MLVPMVVIGLRFAGELLGREVTVQAGLGVTPDSLGCRSRDPGTGQYVLNAGARHRAGREGIPTMTSGSSDNIGSTSRSSMP